MEVIITGNKVLIRQGPRVGGGENEVLITQKGHR